MIDEHATANWFSRPGDTIRAIMQRREIPPQVLVQCFSGSVETVKMLLDGSRRIDEKVAGTLAEVLGASPKFWLKRQENFDLAVERAVAHVQQSGQEEALLGLPAPGKKIGGKLTAEKREAELRKRLVFYNVHSVESWTARYGHLVGDTDYRTSKAFAAKEDATLLWLRRGELEADMVSTRTWSSGNLQDRLEAIRNLSKIRHPHTFLPRLRTLCAESGVALVVVKAPEGCRASGAVRMVEPDKAMLLLSFRYRRDDQFWFTVFHEIGHLILHKADTFVDDEAVFSETDRENEANDFAAACIIPPERVLEFEHLTPRMKEVIRFSVSIGVGPGLTVGQMQHRGIIGYKDRLNHLKRTWDWNEINPATV